MLDVPDNVPANEFLNLEGRKLSTSRGFAVWLPEFLEKFEADPLRYTLARNAPESRDMNFTWEGFRDRNNGELGNNFGNLINRVFSFVHKYFEGMVPEWSDEAMTDLDRQALAEVEAALDKWAGHLEKFEVKAAVETAFHAGGVGNRYFDESAPFKTRKTDMARCGQSLAVALQVVDPGQLAGRHPEQGAGQGRAQVAAGQADNGIGVGKGTNDVFPANQYARACPGQAQLGQAQAEDGVVVPVGSGIGEHDTGKGQAVGAVDYQRNVPGPGDGVEVGHFLIGEDIAGGVGGA